MSFEDYDPPSSLKVEGKVIKKAKFTFIDVHSHLWNMPIMDLNELVAEMDEINMGYIVNLSGSGFGPQAAKDAYFDKSTEGGQRKTVTDTTKVNPKNDGYGTNTELLKKIQENIEQSKEDAKKRQQRINGGISKLKLAPPITLSGE